jgi:hypothetical protein
MYIFIYIHIHADFVRFNALRGQHSCKIKVGVGVKYRKYEKKSISMKSYSIGFAFSHKGSLVCFWRGPKSASATMSREI